MKANKFLRERIWFELWVKEGYSVRQISQISGHSEFKIKTIKNYWLGITPEEQFDYRKFKYLLFDGTYFGKCGCLIAVMDGVSGVIIANKYVDKERYSHAFELLSELKQKGLNPKAITLDGHIPVMRALKSVWVDIVMQRCLYHIQREGMRWLRSYPKTQAGKELRWLLRNLSAITNNCGRNNFWNNYDKWLKDYSDFINKLPNTTIAYKDLKKTRSLINNARVDMFYFIGDNKIQSTTNKLEGFFSRLKADYRKHRGLSRENKISYLKWYCYFENKKIINTF